MPYNVDFHTHSVASPDGTLTEHSYQRMLEQGSLDYIAVTDHNTTDMAVRLREVFGDRIIVGEEVMTTRGELVGLYLTETVPPMLTPTETVQHIHAQGGLVYVPHPFETARKGLSAADLQLIASQVDIMEVYNGRAVFQNKTAEAVRWAEEHHVPAAASSDAHGRSGWGRTYTVLAEAPTRNNVLMLLLDAEYSVGSPGVRGVLYPKFNRLRKWRRHA